MQRAKLNSRSPVLLSNSNIMDCVYASHVRSCPFPYPIGIPLGVSIAWPTLQTYVLDLDATCHLCSGFAGPHHHPHTLGNASSRVLPYFTLSLVGGVCTRGLAVAVACGSDEPAQAGLYELSE